MFNDTQQGFKKSNVVHKIIYINVVVFLFCYILEASNLVRWFALPVNGLDLIQRIWTIFTYMFLHLPENANYFLLNLLGFYFIGNLFLRYMNQKQLLSIYILGGVFSGLAFILSFNFFPGLNTEEGATLMGASGSIFAILFAIATYIPNQTVQVLFIQNIKLKYIAIFLILILGCLPILLYVLSFKIENKGDYIAHLGGAFFGYFYAKQLKSGNDITIWFTKLIDISKAKKKLHSVHKRPDTDQEFRNQKATQKKEIDIILEKIAKSGYDSLTKKEKGILFNASKK